jgi:NAD(P)-dependent dehydrogenase (short-subunit alcohol dehydrogenase family)
MTDELKGRTALVTGATSGIGKVTARELARRGARVLVHGRSPAKVDATVTEIRAATGGTVEGVLADFASLAEVRALADDVRRRTDRLDVLVNNAGLAAIRRSLSRDGIELTFAVNHLAPFLLTNLLLDRLRHGGPARIVTVASEAHRVAPLDPDDLETTRGYRGFRTYGKSKLCNILFTFALARRLADTAVTANAVHPGTVDTGIWNAARGPLRPLVRVMQWFMISEDRGAAPLVRLAAQADVANVTGTYFDRFKPREPAPQARDVALQERLWEASERFTRSV